LITLALDRAFPSAVIGPDDFRAFNRFAATREALVVATMIDDP